MRRLLSSLPLLTTLALAASGAGAETGQAPAVALLRQAERLAAGGRLTEAEAAYERILESDSGSVSARLGRAHVRSWLRKFDLARADFEHVLASDPGNVAALTGLGYTLAWSGRHSEAERRFREALRVAPGSLDALRGLAYVSLWRPDPEEALRRFADLRRRLPRDPDIELAYGQALLAAGNKREARGAFERVLRLKPDSREAREGLKASRGFGVRLDLTAYGGSTLLDSGSPDGDTRETGLRFAEVAVQTQRHLRLWAQYDDGLSQDSFGLARADRRAPTYYVGGFGDYGGRHITRLEYGYRRLPGEVSQHILRGEQVLLLRSQLALKAGLWAGPRSDDRTEWILHAGVGAPAGERFRLESTVFYSESGLAGERQVRGLLFGERSFAGGGRVGAGVAAGRESQGEGAGSETVLDVFVNAAIPVGSRHRVRLLLRHESLGSRGSVSVLALGFTAGFGGAR